MITQVLHTGFGVQDIDQAVELYQKMGFVVDKRFEKPEPHLLAALMTHPNGSGVELLQFIDTAHPQVAYIQNHIALESDDFEKDIEQFVKLGCSVVVPITKGMVLTYAYLRDPSGNYIEIDKKGA